MLNAEFLPNYKESNHLLKVLESIPKGVNKRLSRISCTEEIFNQGARDYQDALERSGYNFKLNYQPEENTNESSLPKRKRCRKIIYFYPPFSKDVKTNVGKQFLQAMDKHSPKGNPLHKIFNRNNVKMSYRCTANLGLKIAAHNSKILKSGASQDEETKTCSCRNKLLCPVENKV